MIEIGTKVMFYGGKIGVVMDFTQTLVMISTTNGFISRPFGVLIEQIIFEKDQAFYSWLESELEFASTH